MHYTPEKSMPLFNFLLSASYLHPLRSHFAASLLCYVILFFALVPHHYGLHLLVKLLLRGVQAAAARRAANRRLHLYITLAAYAAGHHTHRLVLAVIELCAAVATLDNISNSHSCKVLSCYSPHFVSAPVMYNITLAVIAKSIKIRNISVSFLLLLSSSSKKHR